MRTVCRAIFLLAVVMLAKPADAQRCLEVSRDGRLSVILPDCRTDDDGSVAGAGGSDVPFHATPDWSNTLRRQVAHLRVADVNGDGHPDLVVGCYTSNSFPPYDDWHNLIYLNTGTALETNPSWISSDMVHTNDVQVADLNGDGFKDVFSANGGSAMSPSVIYFGGPGGPSTTPGWTSTVPGQTWSTSARVLDFDHDGDLDVITSNQGNSPIDPFRPIYIFRSNGGTLPTTPTALSSELSIQSALALGDHDHDGWEDLAVSKWTNGFQSGVYRNVSGNFVTAPSWTTGVSDTDKGVAWADVDGNGWIDLALGAATGTQLWSNTGGTFTHTWTSLAPFPSQQDLAFADVDGDGDPDLAEIHFSTGRTHIYLNRNGVLDQNPTWTYDAAPVGTALAFGDINGDGRLDMVTGYSGQPSIMIFYGQPLPCPADLDHNGAVDVNDLLAVVSHWGACPQPPICPGDVNGSGVVDVNDLLAIVSTWGACP